MASSESQARLTQSEPAKWIVVYKNGDQHFPGRRMVVKPREIKTFNNLLEEVTLKLNPSFGAVRNIFTPEGGTRVSSLTELKPNGHYVASPNEPFRQLSRIRYGEIPAQSTSHSHSRVSLQPSTDKVRRQHAVPSRHRSIGSDELVIHVFRNGDAFTAASPLRVDRLARSNWRETLARLGDKLRIGRRVHKLYNLRGQLVRDPSTDLEHNGMYVAATDSENFRLVNYGASREPFQNVTRGDRAVSEISLPTIKETHQKTPGDRGRSRPRGVSLPPAVPDQHARAPVRRRPSSGARDRDEDDTEEEDREYEEDAEESEEHAELDDEEGAEWKEVEGRTRVGRVDSAYGSDVASPPVEAHFRLSESEYFKAKTTPRQVVQVNLDRDEGGVYRHHSTERRPPELPDAPDLHTELPLDLRAARQVNEELIPTQ